MGGKAEGAGRGEEERPARVPVSSDSSCNHVLVERLERRLDTLRLFGSDVKILRREELIARIHD